MASTKTRRPAPPNVIMSTPPPQSRSKSKYSEVEKQGLLANFDVEVADKTAYFKSILSRTLASFRMREESEILAIPRELRGMTLKELELKWGGGWVGTLQKIRRESFEKKELIREEKEEKEREEVVKGKRKRNGTATADNSPERGGKNPRRDAPTPSSTRKAPPSSTTRGKSASTATKKGKNVVSISSSSKGPSSLPQNHIFNPTLPPTPFFSSKSNKVTSPLSKPSKSSSSKPSSSGPSNHTSDPNVEDDDGDSHDEEEEEEDDDEDEDELPNPEILEAKLLSTKTPSSKSSSSTRIKKKRGPSLIFRQSLLPNSIQSINDDDDEVGEELGGEESEIKHISLSNGRIISFNPFNLTPGRVEKELKQHQLENKDKITNQEIINVKNKVKETVYQSLTERMERWKV